MARIASPTTREAAPPRRGSRARSAPSGTGPTEDRALKRATRYQEFFPEVSIDTIVSHLVVIGTGTALARAVQKHLEQFDINPARYTLLRALYFSENGMLPQSELARDVGSSQPNVTQLLHVLEKDGLVERIIFPENRRVTFARLTDAGRKKCDVLVPDMVRFMEKSTSTLSEKEKAQLRKLLAKVRKSVDPLLAESQ